MVRTLSSAVAAAVEIFIHILKANCHHVFAAADAESGLLDLNDGIPEEIVLDRQLPLADSVELLRLRRAQFGQGCTDRNRRGHHFMEEHVTKGLHALGTKVHFKPL
jgi:hypothetical protein